MMHMLAFDTALTACSAAVVAADPDGTCRVLASHYEPRARGHAEVLAPIIEAVMAEAGLGFDGLDRIAVTTGPGSFTGVRIGIAMARGLRLAAGLPIVTLTTLEAIAANVAKPDGSGSAAIVAAIDARRGEVYVQAFGPGLEPRDEPRVAAVEDAAAGLPAGPVVLAGTGARLVGAAAGHRSDLTVAAADRDLPRAAVFAAAAARRLPDALPPLPLYLRTPDAKLPAAAG